MREVDGFSFQAGGQETGAQTAEPEVPPGTEEEKPAEEAEPKKEPKVCCTVESTLCTADMIPLPGAGP